MRIQQTPADMPYASRSRTRRIPADPLLARDVTAALAMTALVTTDALTNPKLGVADC